MAISPRDLQNKWFVCSKQKQILIATDLTVIAKLRAYECEDIPNWNDS